MVKYVIALGPRTDVYFCGFLSSDQQVTGWSPVLELAAVCGPEGVVRLHLELVRLGFSGADVRCLDAS